MNKLEQLKKLNLQCEKVFSYFEELCAIPHGSRNTKQISDYLAGFAAAHGLEYYQDALNNIVMIQEATEGYEQEEPIILQGHMDMVCEKESGCEIDFEKDGLDLYVDGDFIRARGTTLGGDDGIAIAYALAILDSPGLAHPRLEVIFTVDEEIGMLGAAAIDLSMLKGHRMLNIDSDVEGHFLTSCAGGMTVTAKLPVSYTSRRGQIVRVTVNGLCGGHSGSEIDKEHANAILIMGRFLKALFDCMDYGIAELAGGLKDNAIPRECSAKLLLFESDTEVAELVGANAMALEATLKKEFSVSDPGIRITVEAKGEAELPVLSPASMTKLLFYLRSVPNGVQNRSVIMPGLVETSLNAGIMKLEGEQFTVQSSLRSSVSSRKEELRDKIEMFTEFLGGEIEVSGDYTAWEYKEESALRDTISAVYQELFGEQPVFEAIHAGLECGILSEKIRELDCVSFGPNNYDIHTPKERLSISSTEKVWRLLVEILKRSNGRERDAHN